MFLKGVHGTLKKHTLSLKAKNLTWPAFIQEITNLDNVEYWMICSSQQIKVKTSMVAGTEGDSDDDTGGVSNYEDSEVQREIQSLKDLLGHLNNKLALNAGEGSGKANVKCFIVRRRVM